MSTWDGNRGYFCGLLIVLFFLLGLVIGFLAGRSSGGLCCESQPPQVVVVASGTGEGGDQVEGAPDPGRGRPLKVGGRVWTETGPIDSGYQSGSDTPIKDVPMRLWVRDASATTWVDMGTNMANADGQYEFGPADLPGTLGCYRVVAEGQPVPLREVCIDPAIPAGDHLDIHFPVQ